MKKKKSFGLCDDIAGLDPTQPKKEVPQQPPQLPNPFTIFQEAMKPKLNMECTEMVGVSVEGPMDRVSGLDVEDTNIRVVEVPQQPPPTRRAKHFKRKAKKKKKEK